MTLSLEHELIQRMKGQKEGRSMTAQEMPSVEEALDFAIQAIDRGDLKLGSSALDWVLQREPENPVAWLWMACCVSGEEAKRGCYAKIAI